MGVEAMFSQMCLLEGVSPASSGQQAEQEADQCKQMPIGPDSRPLPAAPYESSTFAMMFFKTTMCTKVFPHDWSACPGAHPGERARRRCLLVYRYGANVCPDMQTRGSCPRGESCYMTHGMFEYYMHPLKYKTKMCKSGPACRRHYCFFSHAPEELRESCSIPDDWQLQVLPDGSISSSSAATVLSCLPAEARAAAQSAISQLPQIIQNFEDSHRSGQHMMPMQHHAALQGPGAWSAASMASSNSHYDPGQSTMLLPQAEAQYGSPGMLAGPQHNFMHQQQQDILQYGPACGLPSSQHAMGGMLMAAQQPGSGEHSMMSAPQQQLGAAGASAPYMQGAGLQPGAGIPGNGWVQTAQPVPYGAGNSTAMVMTPAMLHGQPNVLVPAQGSMYLQAAPGPGQQQPYVQAPPGCLMQQQQPGLGPPGMQLQQPQQQQAASLPLAHTVLMQYQQLQPQSQAQGQLQQAQPQMLTGTVVQQAGAGLACMPQQPVSSAAGDQLVQQLQALGLNAVNMSRQL